ncbi:uncharacterized protein LOC111116379 [Crassostrea virginica]
MEKEIIFLCMIHIATGSLSKTAYRVYACPEANNITAWKEASLRLNCSEFSENYSVDVLKGKKLYHCLPSNYLNETIEFCGPNAAIEKGHCPIYKYAYGATTATSYSCEHFTKGCPDPKHPPYHSSSFYKYKACLDINKEFQCFYAEPNCPQREDERYATTSVDLGTSSSTEEITKRYVTTSIDFVTSSSTEENTKRPNAAAIALGCIVVCLIGALIGLLFYFLKDKKRPKEKMDTLLRDENDPGIGDSSSNNIEALDQGEHIDRPLENIEMETHLLNSFEGNNQPQNEHESNTSDDSGVAEQTEANLEEQKRLIKNMRKGASIWCFNDFLERLKKAMTPDVLESIKCRLPERKENSKTDVTGIGNAEQLLNYLDGKYFLFNNVFYLQGLFLASQAPELYDICLEYAKAEVNKVTFFEKKILDKDHTEVKYFINVPNVASYQTSNLEDLRETLVILLFASYDDVIVSGVENGCVIVTFMMRNYLIPCLKALFKSEERIIFQKILEMKIFKVIIQDDIVYIKDRLLDERKSELGQCLKTLPLESSANKTHRDCILPKETVEGTKDTENRIQEASIKKGMKSHSFPLVLTSTIKVPGMSFIHHISVVTPDKLWVSGLWRLKQVDATGHVLRTLNDEYEYCYIGGGHTVSVKGDLVFIAEVRNRVQSTASDRLRSLYGIHNIAADGSITTLFTLDLPYLLSTCIHSSHINGDLLIGLSYNSCPRTGRVMRCDGTGRKIGDIELDEEGQRLYKCPHYITENKINGDIVVSDYVKGALVVVDRSGRHRFDYTGHSTDKSFRPYGVCTDVLGRILVLHIDEDGRDVCCISLLDHDGQFLTRLLTEPDDSAGLIFRSLCVDDKNNIYAANWNKIKIFR